MLQPGPARGLFTSSPPPARVSGSVLFVLSVYYFPTGVVGRLRARVIVKAAKAQG